MKQNLLLLCSLFALVSVAFSGEKDQSTNQWWPQWRGPLATGVAPDANPPIEWSEEKNVRWKAAIPGSGHATPIIWKDQIFILTAVATDKAGEKESAGKDDGNRGMQPKKASNLFDFTVLALDRATGKVKWQDIAREESPHEGTHNDATWASNSPVTDGEFLFAHFGSRGLYCYDLDGNKKWGVDLGDMRIRKGFGEGSSPAIHGETLVVNWDHEDDSFIVALNKRTGKEIWRQERDEVTSWSTPIIVEVNGKAQVIVNATGATRGYDLATGKTVWQVGGMTLNSVPSPVYENGMLYVMSGFRGSMLQAIKLADAQGELDKSNALVWTFEKDTPYVPSAVLYDGLLYFLKLNSGILSCLNGLDGTVNFGPTRLDGIRNIFASPVAAAGHIYVSDRDGTTLVIEKGKEYKVLASNKLDDRFDASAAIAGDALFLRGHQFLYCIAAE